MENSNSHEESLSLETLEAAKPADAPESMPATPEMEQHSPLVEEILDNNHDGEAQESLGGFKPVDPVMAAEAEQLITDFLNTLKKNEEKPETDMAVENADVSIEEAKLPEPEIVDKNASVEEQLLEETEDQKSQKPQMMQDSPIINIMQVQHMPMDYQIPVKVIPMEVQPVSAISEGLEVAKESAPEETAAEEIKESAPEVTSEEIKVAAPEGVKEIPSENIQDIPVEILKEISPDEIKETTPEEMKEFVQESQDELVAKQEETPLNDEQQESLVTASYMPSISIDDIVELVKERLDQTPKKDQMAPMELILTPGAAEPMTLVQGNTEQAEQESQPEEEKEELILPIYKRIAAAEPAMSKVQTLPVTVSKVETVAQPETESQPEIREPKMDARKRRFLFRADAS
ncbi:hypothetical protein M5D96_007671 [Drosophila gunungcola]|uniref:Uncharacterized protein n=2 Tax=Drosophila gunungcola TaxID=103775 RepID=A0A9Q0BP35_9MUSC|nr:hypothetical protein M5D96_007671 [Drosophila gunungcola]